MFFALASTLGAPVTPSDELSARQLTTVAPKVVYGNDDRRDWHELDSSDSDDALALGLLENSIMAHIFRSDLGSPDSDGVYRVLDDYPDSSRLGPARNMCPNQKFLQHPRLSYCSATLVGNSHVITAAHCVWNQMLCDDAAFVFNYYVLGYDDNGNPTFPAITRDDVFFCKSVSTNTGRTRPGTQAAPTLRTSRWTGLSPAAPRPPITRRWFGPRRARSCS